VLRKQLLDGLPPAQSRAEAAAAPVQTEVEKHMYEPAERVLFGAAYYHEYQPHDRLKEDLDLRPGSR
jgi:hypothetical protein